jgi:hypothetical protein
MEMSMRMYLHLEGRNASVIMLASMMGDDLEDILSFFNEPGAARIEIEQPESAEESDLVGTWAWNMDEGYLLIFNEDGTGVRGNVIDSIDDIMAELIDEIDQADLDAFLDEFGEDALLESLMEEFKWEISNDILFIDLPSVGSFGVANEEWDAFIEDDMLTIESRQASGGFSYIRQ